MNHESATTEFKCDYCEKEFDRKWKKSAHEKQHKNFQCDLCDQTFKYLDPKRSMFL